MKIYNKSPLPECDSKEIALKSFFMGPQGENAGWIGELLQNSFESWIAWRKELFPNDGCAISEKDLNTNDFITCKNNIEKTVEELLRRFSKEVPKHSPRYLGHMFSEVSIPALLGHIVTLLYNPNNISGESSRVGIQLETEAIQYLLKMIGYSNSSQGHFTSGGTIANFEAMIRSRSRSAMWLSAAASENSKKGSGKFNIFEDSHMGWENFYAMNLDGDFSKWNYVDHDPWLAAKNLELLYQLDFNGSIILIPENKHYSWKKGCQLLGFGTHAFWPIQLDRFGRMSSTHLKHQIDLAAFEKKPISMIVSVVGTTEMGSIDPVHEVQYLVDEWKVKNGIHLWHHVDAAYGGFLCTMNRTNSKVLSESSTQALSAISNTNSITLDPHKLGYVPYASGTFLVRDQRDYFYKSASDAPYLDYDQLKDKGPYTIEGSRSAAGAVATWMTAKTMGLNPDGYGLLFERTFRIADELIKKLEDSGMSIQIAPGSDSNVICFTCAYRNENLSVSNLRIQRIYQEFSPKQNGAFIVSKTVLNFKSYGLYLSEWIKSWSANVDVDELILIRMCIMNPFLGSKQMDVDFLDIFVKELKKIIERKDS